MLGLVIIPICSEDWTKEQILPSLTRGCHRTSDVCLFIIARRWIVNSKMRGQVCFERGVHSPLSLSLSLSSSLFCATCANRGEEKRKKEEGEKNFWRYTLASRRPRNDLDQLNQHRQTRRDKSKVCAWMYHRRRRETDHRYIHQHQ